MPFDLQPILKGELLELRPLRTEDFHDLYAVAADPLIQAASPFAAKSSAAPSASHGRLALALRGRDFARSYRVQLNPGRARLDSKDCERYHRKGRQWVEPAISAWEETQRRASELLGGEGIALVAKIGGRL